MRTRIALALGCLAAVLLAGCASSSPTPTGSPDPRPSKTTGLYGEQGPSSSRAPFMLPAAPGVQTTSILTTGDSVDGYRMVGKPDGLGAFDNGDGTFTVLMNHELPRDRGAQHAHGGRGAFVSRWVIDKSTLEVLSGSDQIEKVYLWNGSAHSVRPGAILEKLCSADLPALSALFNAETGKGYDGRIYLNGEEVTGGRAFAHVVETGNSYQLPDFHGAKWENLVANPATGDSTVVVATDDTEGGRVYVYVGTKRSQGNPVQRAGLVGGTRYAIAVDGVSTENPSANWRGDARFTLTRSHNASTAWARPEDAAWDPAAPNDLYFATTASFDSRSRLWRLHFDDVNDPTAGGTVSLIVEGAAGASGGPNMMDNLTVDDGRVLVQEDPGSEGYLAGIFEVELASGDVRRVARHDAERFRSGGAYFDTTAEESSGIIPVPFLGEGMYLFDVQDHVGVSDPAIVEKGQLLLLFVPPTDSR